MLVFERFLARVGETFGESVTLKGGLVLELRLERARTTKDVDLRINGAPAALLSRLQEAAQLELDDFMAFEIAPHGEHPTIENDGMQYEGQRFRAECRLAGKPYGQPFGVDVAFGEPLFGAPDVVRASDLLSFAGVARPAIRLYPVETHVAEKLHAYTLPRPRPNSRVKDLPDIALLSTIKELSAPRLRAALEQTFTFRKTHELPRAVPAPPDAWERPYAALARESELEWATLTDVHAAAAAFLDPVLFGAAVETWSPERRVWS